MLEPWKELVRREGRTTLILLLALVIIGSALRLYGLGAESLSLDEMYTVRYAEEEFLQIPASLAAGAHPPLYYMLVHLVLVWGRTEALLRFPSVVAGILAIPLMYAVGRALLGRVQGLGASLLLTTSYIHIRHSQDARMYAMLLLFSLASLYALWKAWKRDDPKWWALFVLATLLNLYNAYFALLVLASETLWLGYLVLRGRSWPRLRVPQAETNPFTAGKARHLRNIVLSFAAIGVLWLPWIPMMWVNLFERQALRESAHLGHRVHLGFDLLERVFGDLSAGTGPVLFLLLGLFLVGFISLLRQGKSDQAVLITLWVTLPFIVVGALRPRKLDTRYVLFLLPIYLLTISQGIDALGGLLKVGRWSVRIKTLATFSVIFIALTLPVIANLRLLPDYYAGPDNPDWRGATQFLLEVVQPSDVLVSPTAPAKNTLLRHYSTSLAERVEIVNLDSIQEKYTTHLRGWIVFGFPIGRADPKGTIRDWIESQDSIVSIPFCGVSAFLWHRGVGPEELAREVIPLLQRAIEVGHPCARLHLALARAYEKIVETEMAIAHYQEALALAPELDQEASFHGALGDAYLASGRAQEAAQEYERALALDANLDQEAWFHRHLGDAYLASGRADEALRQYERTLSLDPERDQRARFHLRLARAYAESGRREEAIAEYERVLELEPDNAAAQRALDLLSR